MKYILPVIIMMTILFVTSTTPFMLNVVLILQTLIISIMLGMLGKTFWFAYILFLVMVGGVLILTTYTICLSSNTKNTLNKKSLFIYPIIYFMFLFMNMQNTILPESFETLEMPLLFNHSMNKELYSLYTMPVNLLNIFLVIMLFIMLMMVEKITINQLGSLRTN